MFWILFLLQTLVGPVADGTPDPGTHHAIYASDDAGPEIDPDG